jgi:hypothetical protein
LRQEGEEAEGTTHGGEGPVEMGNGGGEWSSMGRVPARGGVKLVAQMGTGKGGGGVAPFIGRLR